MRSYIKDFHLCQLFRKEKQHVRQLQQIANLNYGPLYRLQMVLKVIPDFHRGHNFILCIIDEVINYLNITPKHQSDQKE